MAVDFTGLQPQNGFNRFSAGPKRYGVNRAAAATSGPLDSDGYDERARRLREKRLAMIRGLQQNATSMGDNGAQTFGY